MNPEDEYRYDLLTSRISSLLVEKYGGTYLKSLEAARKITFIINEVNEQVEKELGYISRINRTK